MLMVGYRSCPVEPYLGKKGKGDGCVRLAEKSCKVQAVSVQIRAQGNALRADLAACEGGVSWVMGVWRKLFVMQFSLLLNTFSNFHDKVFGNTQRCVEERVRWGTVSKGKRWPRERVRR